MLTKAALTTALFLASLFPLAAGPKDAPGQPPLQNTALASRIDAATHRQPANLAVDAGHGGGAPIAGRDLIVFIPSYDTAGDIVGARGPAAHTRELREIAIYASIGNKDGVAMLSAQLRAQGVSRQAIRDAISRYNVHGNAFTAPAPGAGRGNARHVEAGWEASQ